MLVVPALQIQNLRKIDYGKNTETISMQVMLHQFKTIRPLKMPDVKLLALSRYLVTSWFERINSNDFNSKLFS